MKPTHYSRRGRQLEKLPVLLSPHIRIFYDTTHRRYEYARPRIMFLLQHNGIRYSELGLYYSSQRTRITEMLLQNSLILSATSATPP